MTGTALSDRKYNVYPEYKDSGVRFFNYIPQHWAISKLRFISSFGRGLGITKANLKDTGVPCVSYGEVHSKYGFEVDPTKHNLKCVDVKYLKTSPDSLLSKGDFIFADTSEDIDGSGNFTQLVSDETLFAGYHTVVVRPNPDNYYRFLAYLFDSPEYRTQVRDAVKGVKVFSVTQAILKNTNVWLPTYEEQQKIANFLDHETAIIDTLIAKQEKLIELLKEKRQAVISHAVTRGLNSNIAMKDSGVEWLGEVPEHWRVVKLSYFLKLQSGDSITSSLIEKEGKYPVFGGNGQRGFTSSYNCNGDYVLIGRQGALCGNINIAKNKFFASEHAVVVYPYVEFNLTFIAEFLRFMDLGQYSVSAAQPGISVERIKGLKIAIPPLDEQDEIASYLENKIVKFEQLTERAVSQIDLLKERKIALISATVTGKIDVRDWQGA